MSIKKRLVIIFSLLVLAVVALSYSLYARQSRLLDAADAAIRADDAATAIALLARYVASRAGDAAAQDKLREIQARFNHRFVKLAEQRLAAGENQAAITAYQQHIAHFPEDYATQFTLVELYKELNIYAAAEQLLHALIGREDLSAAARSVADQKLYELINAWANETKRQADHELAVGNSQAAIRLYTQTIALRARNPALRSTRGDWSMAVRAFDDAVGRRAYAVWQATDLDQAQSVLSTPFDEQIFKTAALYALNKEEQLRYRQRLLAGHIGAEADRLFAEQRWQAAYDTYEQAKYLRRLAIGREFDLNIAAMQFNQVTATLRLQLNTEALRLFEALRKQAPYYEPARMRQLQKVLALPTEPPARPPPY